MIWWLRRLFYCWWGNCDGEATWEGARRDMDFPNWRCLTCKRVFK